MAALAETAGLMEGVDEAIEKAGGRWSERRYARSFVLIRAHSCYAAL